MTMMQIYPLASEILAGNMRVDDVPDSLRAAVNHALLLPVHHMACEVVAPENDTREKRQAALKMIPDNLSGMVEAEAIRVFKMRAGLK